MLVQLIIFLAMGLAVFLAGLRVMVSGLKLFGYSVFSRVLQLGTGSKTAAFFSGIVFSALTQSSSLTTVLVVGMVEAKMLSLPQAVAIIVGANVGTTITGQLLSFNLQLLALPLLLAGFPLYFLNAKNLRAAGEVAAGLGMLLLGLSVMSSSLSPLGQEPWFNALLVLADHNYVLGIMSGLVTSAMIQSSSAVAGLALALSKEGLISLAAGISLVVGADVGTCVTSMIAGLAGGGSARRAALAHLLFNVVSVLLLLPFFGVFVYLASLTGKSVERQLANAHTLYNLFGAVVVMLALGPFCRLTEYLSGRYEI